MTRLPAPIVVKDIPYDSTKDVAPISTVHVVPLVLLAGPKSALNSVHDLIARLKASPAKRMIRDELERSREVARKANLRFD